MFDLESMHSTILPCTRSIALVSSSLLGELSCTRSKIKEDHSLNTEVRKESKPGAIFFNCPLDFVNPTKYHFLAADSDSIHKNVQPLARDSSIPPDISPHLAVRMKPVAITIPWHLTATTALLRLHFIMVGALGGLARLAVSICWQSSGSFKTRMYRVEASLWSRGAVDKHLSSFPVTFALVLAKNASFNSTMKMEVLAAVTTLGMGLMLLNLAGCYGELQLGFYKGKCGKHDVEDIVRAVVNKRFIKEPRIVGALLRLQFHDCFVKGCDASILLDGNSSEKSYPPNHSLRGFDIIDQAKAIVEKACPGVVSCADIIVLATRDVVALSGGLLMWRYNVPTGRRDGLSSRASNVDLPPPSVSVSESIAKFASKGLNLTDMVLLLGGHTVGVTHCSTFQNRLYNFKDTGKPDPTMDPLLAMTLRFKCPKNASTDNLVDLDQNILSTLIVDNSYYNQIKTNRGILQIDQELALNALTKDIVANIANGFNFPDRFAAAMVKLSTIEVLTGTEGEIRSSCRSRNI